MAVDFNNFFKQSICQEYNIPFSQWFLSKANQGITVIHIMLCSNIKLLLRYYLII
jgi:hypothetical protein